MDRGRDRRYEGRDSTYAGSGETYRPFDRHGRSPPRGDNYRGPRSPPRRDRTPPQNDVYIPRGGRGDDRPRSRSPRRRSRSPPFRGRDNGPGYRGRARSPPRGNGRAWSPLPQRRRSRSPYNAPPRPRSPLPQKRGRDNSPPASYRQRSPPPTKYGRYSERERDGYDRRGYTPPREAPSRYPPRENNYRPRERSRTPPRVSANASRGASPISSRRSSPPMHPDRMAINARSPGYGSARHEPPLGRSPAYRARERSPIRRPPSPLPRSPVLESANWRDNSPPPRDREPLRSTATPNTWSNAQMGQPPPHSHHNGDSRPYNNGPPPRHDDRPRDPPPSAGPPSAPISMSAHNRPASNPLLSAPTRPRGGPAFGRDTPRDAPYAGPPPHRGGRHYNVPPPLRTPSGDPSAIPTGPRSAYPADPPPPRFEPPRPAFRTNNSSSTTYPRTQRFTAHLPTVPAPGEGGKKLPSGLDPVQEKRLAQLEEERKRLLEVIEEKQKVKRQGLREWEKVERESASAAVRSELADGHLGRLSGEGGGGGAGAY